MKKNSASSPMKLDQAATHFIHPVGITTSEYPKVGKLLSALGVNFDPWQQALSLYLLGKRPGGRYACSIGGGVLSLPRQIGKTFTIGNLVTALCLLHPGLTVLWTAHRTRTSDETFRTMVSMTSQPSVKRYTLEPRRANGQQEIGFKNGGRILFGAREQGFGRGFSGIDIEVFDEAQILTERALDDMIPATNAAPNPLIIYMGTPPRPSDPSEVFTSKRKALIEGVDKDGLYLEFSADRSADLDDRSQWSKANPSYPLRTSESSILRMRRQLSDDSFRREALGVWAQHTTVGAINIDLWEQGTVDARQPGGLTSYGLDMSPDRRWLCIAACTKYEDGTAQIGLAEMRDTSQEGTMWAVNWLKDRWPDTAGIGIDSISPAMTLMPELVAAHMKPLVFTTRQVGQASGRFMDMLTQGQLRHLAENKQQPLWDSIKGATTRPLGKAGQFGWNKTGSDIDITPLTAATYALQAAYTSKRHPGRKARIMI